MVYANHSGTTTLAPNSDITTSSGLGGYVAHGLGMIPSITGSENLTTTVVTAYTTTFIADQISTYIIGEDDVTSLSASNNISATVTPAPSTKTGNRTSLTCADAVCQESWNTYWSLLGEYSMGGVYGVKSSTSTVKTARVTGYLEDETGYITEVSTEPGYLTWTTLYTSSAMSSPTPPSCSPPIDASACASSWLQYTSSLGQSVWWAAPGAAGDNAFGNPLPVVPTLTVTPPECYNPPVNSSYCSYLASEYRLYVSEGPDNEGVFNPGNSLAPGCTLGCGSCTLSALSFQLLYWGTQASNITSSVPVTVVISDSTTLTSPQVYLSFAQLWASNTCGQVGNTITNGIVAINTTSLSYVVQYGPSFIITPEAKRDLSVRSVNALIPIGPTNMPLPFSEFLSWQAENSTSFQLSVPPEIQALERDWSGCGGWAFGM